MTDIMSTIEAQLKDNPIILYMKGTPDFPQCGFSARTVDILKAFGVDFAFVNILEHPDIRESLKEYAQWPTYPQLWINAELVGGCDIVAEMAENGELQELLSTVSN